MFQGLTPITRNLIIINVVLYLIANFLPGLNLYELLSAYYPFSPNFQSWQIVTHMFMHAPFGGSFGIMHILFNMLTLMSFGPILEQTLGDKKYFILYFASGLGAFLLFNLWNFYQINEIVQSLENLGINSAEIFQKADLNYAGDLSINATTQEGVELSQKLFMALRSTMLGASGAIFGVVAAFATMFPDAKLSIMLIPYPIKAKYILPVVIIVSVYLGFSGDFGGIAHFAHVGGALVGFLLAKLWKNNQYRIN